jgi:hypothetical protein
VLFEDLGMCDMVPREQPLLDILLDPCVKIFLPRLHWFSFDQIFFHIIDWVCVEQMLGPVFMVKDHDNVPWNPKVC